MLDERERWIRFCRLIALYRISSIDTANYGQKRPFLVFSHGIKRAFTKSKMDNKKSPEERWKDPLFSQSLLSPSSSFKVNSFTVVLLSLLASAALPGTFLGLLWVACAVECQALPWMVLLGGPFVAFGVFVTLLVLLYKLTDRIRGNSARYLKNYLGILFFVVPVLAIKFWLF